AAVDFAADIQRTGEVGTGLGRHAPDIWSGIGRRRAPPSDAVACRRDTVIEPSKAYPPVSPTKDWRCGAIRLCGRRLLIRRLDLVPHFTRPAGGGIAARRAG